MPNYLSTISYMINANNALLAPLGISHYLALGEDTESLSIHEYNDRTEESKLDIVCNYDTYTVYVEYVQYCAMLFCELPESK